MAKLHLSAYKLQGGPLSEEVTGVGELAQMEFCFDVSAAAD